MVDWRGAGVTPRVLASQMRPWSERVSEAAQRRPPRKDAGGTEINLSPCQKVIFSY